MIVSGGTNINLKKKSKSNTNKKSKINSEQDKIKQLIKDGKIHELLWTDDTVNKKHKKEKIKNFTYNQIQSERESNLDKIEIEPIDEIKLWNKLLTSRVLKTKEYLIDSKTVDYNNDRIYETLSDDDKSMNASIDDVDEENSILKENPNKKKKRKQTRKSSNKVPPVINILNDNLNKDDQHKLVDNNAVIGESSTELEPMDSKTLIKNEISRDRKRRAAVAGIFSEPKTFAEIMRGVNIESNHRRKQSSVASSSNQDDDSDDSNSSAEEDGTSRSKSEDPSILLQIQGGLDHQLEDTGFNHSIDTISSSTSQVLLESETKVMQYYY